MKGCFPIMLDHNPPPLTEEQRAPFRARIRAARWRRRWYAVREWLAVHVLRVRMESEEW